jgi:hypothetical protein
MNITARKAVISLVAGLTFGAIIIAMTSETQAWGGVGFRGGGVGFGGLRGVGFAGRGFANPGLAGRGWGWGGRGWGGRGLGWAGRGWGWQCRWFNPQLCHLFPRRAYDAHGDD